jgi:hypothetical protein
VVLFFYPLDFTFVCPTEITAFSDRYAEFAKLDTEVSAGRAAAAPAPGGRWPSLIWGRSAPPLASPGMPHTSLARPL